MRAKIFLIFYVTSWAFDRAFSTLGNQLIDNRAYDIACYHPGYTFVEKLQTIATKYRQEQEMGEEKPNLMRQYYYVYCLLELAAVQEFLSTDAYRVHRENRFPIKDYEIPISQNDAFVLPSVEQRQRFKERYLATKALYYNEQPDFDVLIKRIGQYIDKL